MNVRHQYGHLRSMKRKAGPPAWEYLWRETDQSGKRVRKNVVIGTLEEYPTEELAQATVNGLGRCINADRNRQLQQAVYISDVIDHYSTRLIANGENVKVVQELMRHSNSRATLEVYSQARIRAKREAQQRLVDLIIPDTQIYDEANGSG